MPIDSALGTFGFRPGICTSTTRPANPYEGQVIYETDTKNTLVWNGSVWTYLSFNRVMGYAQITADQNGITTITDITGLSTTFTAVAGRRYRVSTHVPVNTSTGTLTLSVRENTTQLAAATWSVNSTYPLIVPPLTYINNSSISGSKTWKLSAAMSLNTVDIKASATSPAFILVEDIGSLT